MSVEIESRSPVPDFESAILQIQDPDPPKRFIAGRTRPPHAPRSSLSEVEMYDEEDEYDYDTEDAVVVTPAIVERPGPSPSIDIPRSRVPKEEEDLHIGWGSCRMKHSPSLPSLFEASMDLAAIESKDEIETAIVASRTQFARKPSSLMLVTGDGLLGSVDVSKGIVIEKHGTGLWIAETEVDHLYQPYMDQFRGRPHINLACSDYKMIISVLTSHARDSQVKILIRCPSSYRIDSLELAFESSRESVETAVKRALEDRFPTRMTPAQILKAEKVFGTEKEKSSKRFSFSVRRISHRDRSRSSTVSTLGESPVKDLVPQLQLKSPRSRDSMTSPTRGSMGPRSQSMVFKKKSWSPRSLRTHDTSSTLWKTVTDSVVPHLINFDSELSINKIIKIGIIAGHPTQTEEQMMRNNPSQFQEFDYFMTIVMGCERTFVVPSINKDMQYVAYTRMWKGFTMRFHLALLMEGDQQRKFIGNDKVLLYYIKRDKEVLEDGEKFMPAFRGKVNSYAIVVSPSPENFSCFDMATYYRAGMDVSNDIVPAHPVRQEMVSDIVFRKCVNGNVAAYNFHYGARMQRMRKTRIQTIFEKMKLKKK